MGHLAFIKGDLMLKIQFLSGNMLKILAAVAMLSDHIGLLFFPGNIVFRIVGRLAFPIFAFMIAEGTKYTRNKAKYFSMIFGLAFICQVICKVQERTPQFIQGQLPVPYRIQHL